MSSLEAIEKAIDELIDAAETYGTGKISEFVDFDEHMKRFADKGDARAHLLELIKEVMK